MPVQRFLILLMVVLVAAAVTIGLAYALGLNFVWVGLVVLVATLVVRRWS